MRPFRSYAWVELDFRLSFLREFISWFSIKFQSYWLCYPALIYTFSLIFTAPPRSRIKHRQWRPRWEHSTACQMLRWKRRAHRLRMHWKDGEITHSAPSHTQPQKYHSPSHITYFYISLIKRPIIPVSRYFSVTSILFVRYENSFALSRPYTALFFLHISVIIAPKSEKRFFLFMQLMKEAPLNIRNNRVSITRLFARILFHLFGLILLDWTCGKSP